MEEMTREQQAAEVLKTMRLFIEEYVQKDTATQLAAAGTDQSKQRRVASKIATFQRMTNAKDWEPNMTTEPGDIVYDPDHNYQYIFSGNASMTHSNPLYYPGSAGVYYWLVIPRIKDFVKIYPDVQGIIVSVKQGEIWWNTSETAKYEWVGVDNDNCVWPPQDGMNEWKRVDE